jgi:hypothetical protein
MKTALSSRVSYVGNDDCCARRLETGRRKAGQEEADADEDADEDEDEEEDEEDEDEEEEEEDEEETLRALTRGSR